jgi:adenine-specific DNA-methyltransferase
MADTPLETLRRAILELLPPDGGSIGNQSLRERLSQQLGTAVSQEDYFAARDSLLAEGMLATGRGRGGSVRRAVDEPVPAEPLILAAQEKPAGADEPAPRQAAMSLAQARQAKTEAASRRASEDARVIAYRHDQKRKNNPDVGVVTPETDPEQPRTTWAWDPHIDPALQFDVGRAQIERLIDDALASGDESVMRQALEELKRLSEPYLNWAGKAERTSFEVDTVSLHVHERIDPASLLAVVKKRLKKEKGEHGGTGDLFRAWFEEPLPYREAIEFYRHDRGWANRLVAGDSLLVMNSLLQKEGMAGQVQMIYIDPPYGIKYGSNFQPFVNKRDVKDRKDEDLTQEPEMIKAFRDTWELGIHSYLTYLRDRLLLAKELLHESGSVFVQISDENLHHVRELCDEIFGSENFVSQISYLTTSGAGSPAIGTKTLAATFDHLVWYAKNRATIKYRQPYAEKSLGGEGSEQYVFVQEATGLRRRITKSERTSFVSEGRVFRYDQFTSQSGVESTQLSVTINGQDFVPAKGGWKTNQEGAKRLQRASRLYGLGSTLTYVRFIDDFAAFPINNFWDDTRISGFGDPKAYVVQTASKVIERCLLMTTDPGDLVLDPTCGSGTTAYVAEKWGRRWITCDTSRVAVTLAKQRLMTASYDYYALKYPHEGLRGGFIYKTVPHVTLKSIANNPEIDEIYERMHPAIGKSLENLNDSLTSGGGGIHVD